MYTTVAEETVFFRPAQESDLDAVYALEVASYPEDEAAPCDRLDFRMKNAGDYFLVAVESRAAGDQVAGFVCGTCTRSSYLTHESFGKHEPDGELLCVHSVVVAPERRRRGLATRLLHTYLQLLSATSPQLREVRLLCKEALVPLYQGAGFELVGPSDVQHGQDQWLEMRHVLNSLAIA